MTGNIEIIVLEDDLIKGHQRMRNIVTLLGRTELADLLRGQGDPAMYLAVGTGSRAPAAADTALQTEVYRDQVTDMSAASGELTISHFLPGVAAVGHTLREVGLWTAASGGSLLARALLDRTITKTDRITASITWVIRFSSS